MPNPKPHCRHDCPRNGLPILVAPSVQQAGLYQALGVVYADQQLQDPQVLALALALLPLALGCGCPGGGEAGVDGAQGITEAPEGAHSIPGAMGRRTARGSIFRSVELSFGEVPAQRPGSARSFARQRPVR